MDTRRWAPEVVAIAEEIVGLSIANAGLLSEYLEQVHGVRAEVVNRVATPERVKEEVAPPFEPTEFSVVLEGFDAAKKLNVIKTVRDNLGLGLKDARDFVDAAPKAVKDRLPKCDAEKLKAQLDDAGARVTLKPAAA